MVKVNMPPVPIVVPVRIMPRDDVIAKALQDYSAETPVRWVQEEPENMGAWTFIEPRLRTIFCTEIAYAGREASASPAVGALARHKREQARLVADAFSV